MTLTLYPTDAVGRQRRSWLSRRLICAFALLTALFLVSLPQGVSAQDTSAQDTSAQDTSAQGETQDLTSSLEDALPETGVLPEENRGPTPLSAYGSTENQQQAAARPVLDMDAIEAQHVALRDRLQQVERLVTGNLETLADRRIDDLIGELDGVVAEASQLGTNLAPRLEQLKAQVEALTPEEGVRETALPESVQQELNTVRDLSVRVDSVVRSAQALTINARELADGLKRLQLERYVGRFTRRDRSIANPQLLLDAVRALPTVVGQVGGALRQLAPGADMPWQEASGVTAGLIIYLVIVLGPLRGLIRRRALRQRNPEPAHGLERATAAASVLLVFSILPILAIFLMIAGLIIAEVEFGEGNHIIIGLLIGLTSFFLLFGLTRALTARGHSGWRLVALGDDAVERLIPVVLLINIALSLGGGITFVLSRVAAPVDFLVAFTGVGSILVGLLTAFALRVVVSGLAGASQDAGNAEDERAQPVTWRLVISVYWMLTAVAIFGPLAGFSALGWFCSIQIGWISVVLGLAHIFLQLSEEGFAVAFRPAAPMGRFLQNNFGIQGGTVEVLSIVGAGLVRLIMIAIAIMLIAIPWGFSSRDMVSAGRAAVMGFQLGGITISISTIIAGLLVFLAIVFITRSLQRWLDDRLLPRTRLDVGLRTSIRTGLGYLGFIVAAMVAVSYAGISLQNVAIVAGALSVGIGFGLQSIVNNFVSGLILLAERPIKVGDWIVVGPEQGYVKRINVRATEIETFDKAAVIIPNSDLISGTVKNWMHGNPLGRTIIEVPVSRAADPNEVYNILLEAAESHPMVVRYPETFIYFKSFGEHALLFEIRCFISQADYMLNVASELRFDVWRRLKQAGIEVPLPQSVVHLGGSGAVDVKSGESTETALTSPPPRARATDAGMLPRGDE